jgi:hypothetical protein
VPKHNGDFGGIGKLPRIDRGHGEVLWFVVRTLYGDDKAVGDVRQPPCDDPSGLARGGPVLIFFHQQAYLVFRAPAPEFAGGQVCLA